MASKKKIATAAVATTLAASLLLGGTFAWQSISQTALNEKEAVVNPGGRLHDDFNGTNKDVYVENFAENDIYARVRLDEYFEIVMNKGTAAEKTEQIAGTDKDDTSTYVTHLFDAANETDTWWDWTTGGSTTYMPTFNMNKDSLVADINGTMDYEDGEGNADPYGDYVDYTLEVNKTKTATEIYDGDTNSIDEVGTDFDDLDKYAENIKTIENKEHTAAATGTATLISMAEWLALGEDDDTDNYWVYDTDGWVYYSSPIEAGTATGLLLDGISLNQVMDDTYYYAINVVAQFITADDLGSEDDATGFYADGETVSENALTLLEKIGVDVGYTTGEGGTGNDETPKLKFAYQVTQSGLDTTVNLDFLDVEYTDYEEICAMYFYNLGKNANGAYPETYFDRVTVTKQSYSQESYSGGIYAFLNNDDGTKTMTYDTTCGTKDYDGYYLGIKFVDGAGTAVTLSEPVWVGYDYVECRMSAQDTVNETGVEATYTFEYDSGKYLKFTDPDGNVISDVQFMALTNWDEQNVLVQNVDYEVENGYIKLTSDRYFHENTLVVAMNDEYACSLVLNPVDELILTIGDTDGNGTNAAYCASPKIGEGITLRLHSSDGDKLTDLSDYTMTTDNSDLSSSDYTFEDGVLTITNPECVGTVITIYNAAKSIKDYPYEAAYLIPRAADE